MATEEIGGGFSNAAMDTQDDVDIRPQNDGVCLRVDGLLSTQPQADAIRFDSNSGTVELRAKSMEDLEMESEMIDIGNADLPPNIRRDRPFSASATSRRSTGSTRSHVSKSPSIRTSDYSSKNLFAHRPEVLDKAVDDSVKLTLNAERDGELKGFWLLTEIDHWDHEMERLILLTEKSLLIVKYDFIKMKMIEAKQIPFACIIKVQIGDLQYPKKSFMPSRDYGGIRIHFGSTDDIWFSQRWNPWSRAIPFVTLTHHLLAYHPEENETVTYNADEMAESLVTEMESYRRTMVSEQAAATGGESTEGDGEGEAAAAVAVVEQTGAAAEYEHVIVEDAPIVVDSYASLMAVIFNQSKLGFYLERGGVSF